MSDVTSTTQEGVPGEDLRNLYLEARYDLWNLADEWTAAAARIGARTFAGDPTATIATVQTLERCASSLRAALSGEDAADA